MRFKNGQGPFYTDEQFFFAVAHRNKEMISFSARFSWPSQKKKLKAIPIDVTCGILPLACIQVDFFFKKKESCIK